MSLRKAINAKCESCTYDKAAPGTWLQQVTLCSVTSCPLWPHRPRTKAKIAGSVLCYHGIDSGEFQAEHATPAPGRRQSDLPCKNGESSDSEPNSCDNGEVDGCVRH